jgi:hypothetical protein
MKPNPETCPIRTIQTWIEQAALLGGALFRSINRHGQVQAGRLSGIDVARGQETRTSDRTGRHGLRWALAAGGPCDQRGDCWGVGMVDHEADRTSERSDGASLYPGR